MAKNLVTTIPEGPYDYGVTATNVHGSVGVDRDPPGGVLITLAIEPHLSAHLSHAEQLATVRTTQTGAWLLYVALGRMFRQDRFLTQAERKERQNNVLEK